MVKCILRSHHKTYNVARPRGDDAENMCGSSLEPDNRYDSPCSNIFRPGRVLRDLIVGFLVVLGIAVVIAVLFVVCIYLVPSEKTKEGPEVGPKETLIGGPREDEININEVLTEVDIILENVENVESTGYDVGRDKDFARIEDASINDPESHPEPESEPEPKPETEPEPEPETEPETEPESEPEPETEFEHNHDHVSHHHSHDSEDQNEHDHSHTDHDHADHMHEHPDHHMEHPDHDDMHHMHMEDAMPVELKPENMDNDQMDHTGHSDQTVHMDNAAHMEHGDQMDQTAHVDLTDNMEHTGNMEHVDHMDHGDQMLNGDHMTQGVDLMDIVDDMDHTGAAVHQPQEDVMIMEEHLEINHQPEFGDPALNPAFAPSAPLFDENAVIEIVRAPTLESDIPPTERTVEAPVEIDVESVVLTDVVIEETLPPLLEILSPGPQDDLKSIMDDLPVTDTPREEEPLFPESPFEEVFPPVLLPVEFPSEDLSSPTSDAPATPELLPVTQVADITEPELTGVCRPRSLEMCADMPYASTMLPNWVNDQNTEDLLNVSLPYFRDIIVRSKCSPRARSFACAVLEPPCVMDTAGQDTILPPCRSFCRSVGTTCAEFIISGFALSDVFECERFPDSTDPSVCFDMSQAPVDVLKVTTPEAPAALLPTSDVNNSGIQDSPDYSNFPLEVNGGEIFRDTLSSVAPENQAEFVSETSFPRQADASLGLDDQTLSATEESEVIVKQQSLDEAPESLEPSIVGEVTSPQEFLEEVPEGPLICTLDMFLCWDGSDCLDASALCDGFQHCIDHSDEHNCTTTESDSIECAGDDFRCGTTPYCVPRSWLCDGADDCRDNSDEENCNSEGFPLTAGAAALGLFPPPSSIVGNSFESNNPFPNDIDRNDRDERAFEGSIPSQQALIAAPPGPNGNNLPTFSEINAEPEILDEADSILQQEQLLNNPAPSDAPNGSTDEDYIPPSLPQPDYALVDATQQQFSVEQLTQFNTQGNDYEQQSPELSEQILDQDQFLTFQEEPFNNEAQDINSEPGLQEQPAEFETQMSGNEQQNIDSVPTTTQDFQINPEITKPLEEFENLPVLALDSLDEPSIQSEYIPEETQQFETFAEEPQDLNTFSEWQQGFETYPDNTQDIQSLPNQPLDVFGDYQDGIQTFQNEQQQEFQNYPEQVELENDLQEINDQFDNAFNDQTEEIFADLNDQQSQDVQLSGQDGGDISLSEPLEDEAYLSSLNNENILQELPQEELLDKTEEKSQTMKTSEWTTLSPIEEEMIKIGESTPTKTNPPIRGRPTRRPSFSSRTRRPSIRQPISTSTKLPQEEAETVTSAASSRNRRPTSRQPVSITTTLPQEEAETVTSSPSNKRINFRDRFNNWKGNNNKPASIINDPIPTDYEFRRTSSTELRLANFRATRGGDQTQQGSTRGSTQGGDQTPQGSTSQVVSTNSLPSDNRRNISRGRLSSRGRGSTRSRPLTVRRTRLPSDSQIISDEEILKSNASVEDANVKSEMKSEVSNKDEITDNGDISVALPISVPEDIAAPSNYQSSQYSVGLRRSHGRLGRQNQPIPLYLPYPYSDEA